MLDNDLWLKKDGVTFPEDIRQYCADHPRRLATRGTQAAQPAAAWETTPTTVLIGERDDLLSEADRQWAEEQLDDVRVMDTDHSSSFAIPRLSPRWSWTPSGRRRRGR